MARKNRKGDRTTTKVTALLEPPKKKPVFIDAMQAITIDNKKLWVRRDGKIYHKTNSYGGQVFSPIKEAELIELFGGEEKTIVEDVIRMTKIPSIQFRLPTIDLITWAIRLLEFDTEALVVYGRHKIDKNKWMAVVPKQEVTSASVEVDDFSKAVQVLGQNGFQRVGTLHTHPGGMTTCSGTDTGELWDEFGGIHIIVTRTGKASFWYSSRGITWDLSKQKDIWPILTLWNKKPEIEVVKTPINMLCEDGSSDIDKKLTPPIISTYYQSNWQDDYNNRMGFKQRHQPKICITYFGVWNFTTKSYYYDKQKDGTKVGPCYGDHHLAYWSRETGKEGWYAGKEPKVETTKTDLIQTSRKMNLCLCDLNEQVAKFGGTLLPPLYQGKFSTIIDNLDANLAEMDSLIESQYILFGTDKITSLERQNFLKNVSFIMAKLYCCIWDNDMKDALKVYSFVIPELWKKGDKRW